MLKRFKKLIPIIILITIISSLGIFVLETKTAEASFFDITSIARDAIISALSNILYYAILRPVSLALSVAAFLLDWAFGLENFIDVNIVQVGWKITRDMANMFFVLILMVIAFAVIFKSETYGMKKLLPKLIIAALLINFSLIFCGAIIDFAQIMTHFFLEPLEAAGQGDSLSARVAEGLNIMKIFEESPEAPGIDAINVLIGIIFGIAVILVVAFTLAAAAFFLIIRIVALWILIVLAPVAWLLWILPATRNLWDQWWQAFLKWCFFAPVYGFFFYLAIITIIGKEGETGGFLSKIGSKIELGENEGFIDALFSSQELMLQYIFLIILLFGGLIVAQKLGTLGASGAISVAKSTGRKISGTTATQQWWKARKSAKEDEVKERIKRKAQLHRVGGIEQWRKETLRPTIRGRAKARAKKNEVITNEAKKLGATMNRRDIQKIAGGVPLTKAGRMQKLSAQVLLANPKSKAYKQMMSRSTKLTPGISKYEKTKKLARNVNLNVARRQKAREFVRYKLEKSK